MKKELTQRQLLRPIAVACALFLACFQSTIVRAGEKDSLDKAITIYTSGAYPQAERRFVEFAATYTNSTFIPEAFLYQALCRLNQSNYPGALQLLRDKMPPSESPLAYKYAFNIGEVFSRQGLHQEAADAWGAMAKNYPNSPWSLLASYYQGLAYSKLGNWQRVIELLRNPDGDFQLGAKIKPTSSEAVCGFLLLADALHRQHQYAEGEKVILNMAPDGEFAWRRQNLLCRLQLAGGRAREALASAANLPALAADNAQRAENYSVLGEIFENLNQLPNAIAAYTNNLAASQPGMQRQALSKTIDLTLKQNRIKEALAFLANYVAAPPVNDFSMDIACLALGELKLKAYCVSLEGGANAASEAPTNLLQQAMTNLDRVIMDFPKSPLRGRAYLNRGWCSWVQDDISGAKTNFSHGVELLTSPEDREAGAVARFKLADTQFSQQEYGAAVTNYNLVLQECRNVPTLKSNLYLKAFYQVLRASIECKDPLGIAGDAAKNIVYSNPDTLGDINDQCFLLIGEFKNNTNDYVGARKIFARLIEKFPSTSALPEAKYAIARTYIQEGDWSAAAACFDGWVTNFAQHPLLPQAEFSRALAYDKAGFETNALVFFTNFVARFPDNNQAPWAQNWVADYYFNHDDYVSADKNYQEVVQLLQKFPGSAVMAYQTRLMVGRSRFARQEYGEASQWLTKLIEDMLKDTNAPPALLAQTYFALGDTSLQLFRGPNSTKEFCDYAVTAFSSITNGSPTNALAPLAMGRIGDCYFAWAKKNTNNVEGFTNALRAFEAVLKMPQASASALNAAEVNRGLILEQLDKPDEALNCYFEVVFEKDPARRDPYWFKEAGVRAANICVSRKQWNLASNIYQKVVEAAPSLRPSLEQRIARAKEEAGRMQPGGNLK